jgi:PAS domain S-box-containing protein
VAREVAYARVASVDEAGALLAGDPPDLDVAVVEGGRDGGPAFGLLGALEGEDPALPVVVVGPFPPGLAPRLREAGAREALPAADLTPARFEETLDRVLRPGEKINTMAPEDGPAPAPSFERRVLEALGAAVIVTDPRGVVTYWSRAAEELYQWTGEEAVGRPIAELTPSDLSRAEAEEILERLRQGEHWSGEMEVRRKDGSAFPALISDAPVLDPDGGLAGIVGVSTDLTERKTLERKLRDAQKMRAVGRLSAGIAHDFNNLLTAIGGHAEILLEELPARSVLREEAVHIRTAVGRAATLTRQLLAFSRQGRRDPRVLDLGAELEALEPMLRRLLPPGSSLVLRVPGPGCTVEADPAQLQRVVVNLVVNAVDALDGDGTVTLELDEVELGSDEVASFPWEAEPGPYARLRVSDTGGGMPPEVMERAFEPFFTTKGEGKGVGLGLSTVYGVVKQSGGHVFVESEVGIGTSVRVLLPRAGPTSSSQAQPPATGPAGVPAELPTARILVVDDDASVRRTARRILEREGYEVREARDGITALETLARGPEIDLLLSDVVMPEMRGDQLAARVGEVEPGAAVILMSGYAEEEVIEGIRSREVAFLGKPFTADDLRELVARVLGAAGGSRGGGGPRSGGQGHLPVATSDPLGTGSSPSD